MYMFFYNVHVTILRFTHSLRREHAYRPRAARAVALRVDRALAGGVGAPLPGRHELEAHALLRRIEPKGPDAALWHHDQPLGELARARAA